MTLQLPRDYYFDDGILELTDYHSWNGSDVEDIDDYFSPIEKTNDIIIGKLIIKDKKIKCYVQPLISIIFNVEKVKRPFLFVFNEKLVKGKYDGKDIMMSYLTSYYSLKEYEKLMNEKRKNYFQKFSFELIENIRYNFVFMYLIGYEDIKESNINVNIAEIEPRNSDVIDYNFATSRNTSKIITNNKISPSIINKWFKYEPYFLENKNLKQYKGKIPDEIFHQYCKNLCKTVEDVDMDAVLECLKLEGIDVEFIKERIKYYNSL